MPSRTITLINLSKIERSDMLILAEESYADIYNNIMSKGKEKLKPKFLGGNPITLEKNDFANIISEEYMISAKADGLRFLLMISNKTYTSDRRIFLVDKNLHFWTFYKGKEPYLPPLARNKELTGISAFPNCLFDGELLLFGDIEYHENVIIIRDKKSTSKFEIVYSAFDLLYGPINLAFRPVQVNIKQGQEIVKGTGEIVRLEIGNSGGMMGPKGGTRWPWKRRYNVLSTIILNENSLLNIYSRLNYNFSVLLSPFVPLCEVMKNKKPLESMKNIFEKSLNAQNNRLPKTIPTDGIILTPANREYIMGVWNFCKSTVYKYKTEKQLTVDIKVGEKEKSEYDDYKKYKAIVKKDKKLVEVGAIYLESEERDKLNVGEIVECIFLETEDQTDKNLYFLYQKPRPDKTSPNAMLTVLSVLDAKMNPFNLKALRIACNRGIYSIDESLQKYNKNRSNKKLTKDSKIIINELGSKFKTRCIIRKKPEILFNQSNSLNKKSNHKNNNSEKNQILKIIHKYVTSKKNHLELEARIRIPNKSKGLPFFTCIINNTSSGDPPDPIIRMRDFKNKLRKDWVQIGNHHIKSGVSVMKNTLLHTEIKQTNAMKLAKYNIEGIGISLSSEVSKIQNIHFVPKSYRYMQRYEFLPAPMGHFVIPSVLWRLDVTEYGEGKTYFEAKKDFFIYPKTSIELEYAPGDQELLVWRYYTDNKGYPLQEIIKMFSLKVNTITEQSVKSALFNRIKKLKSKSITPEFIYKDFCRLLAWVLQKLY